MTTKRFFPFVIREVIVVSGGTGLATLAMMSWPADDNLSTRIFAGLYAAVALAAISPFFSVLPILLGAAVLRLVAVYRPDRFRQWSLPSGLLAAYLAYLELRLREVVGGFTEMDAPSAFLVALVLVPSLVAWVGLAKRYLR